MDDGKNQLLKVTKAFKTKLTEALLHALLESLPWRFCALRPATILLRSSRKITSNTRLKAFYFSSSSTPAYKRTVNLH